MAARATWDLSPELACLTRALKAPSLRESVDPLADRTRAESWMREEFLAVCLQSQVAAREAHGGEGRIRAGPQPARNPSKSSRSPNAAERSQDGSVDKDRSHRRCGLAVGSAELSGRSAGVVKRGRLGAAQVPPRS